MLEWLVERGVGETRAALIEGGEIIEARILVDGIVPAGSMVEAVLKQGRNPAIAVAGREEYLLPKGALGITQGAAFTIEVTRERIPGIEPWKRPLARQSETADPVLAAIDGRTLSFPGGADTLGSAGFLDLVEEARTGTVTFPGGQLRISPTPAMTLIDIDGHLPAMELALAGARAAARTIRRHGIGGSIEIDLPTVQGKDDRRAIAEAVDEILPQPFERTAVNGFGFLQVVRARRRASLFELAQDRAPFEARALLRHAAVTGFGAKRIVAHPAVVAVLEAHPEWLQQLGRQLGGNIGLRADTALPMSGGYAEQA